jgi:hypothetical protein
MCQGCRCCRRDFPPRNFKHRRHSYGHHQRTTFQPCHPRFATRCTSWDRVSTGRRGRSIKRLPNPDINTAISGRRGNLKETPGSPEDIAGYRGFPGWGCITGKPVLRLSHPRSSALKNETSPISMLLCDKCPRTQNVWLSNNQPCRAMP